MRRTVNENFWKGKRVFLTGHTGFKGSWLSIWLKSMGSSVYGYAQNPVGEYSLFEEAAVSNDMESEIADIRNLDRLKKSMRNFNPDLLIHMAAQPLVRRSYADPIETYSTNVMGTVNVLEAARYCDQLQSIVVVTTDKCYENQEWEWGYRENDPMGGHDPYSNSKGCAELVTSAYRKSYFHSDDNAFVASARAGNVIGGGDWSKDRLIPDVLNAFDKGEKVVIRNPKSTRPWQHVLEPLSGYLILAEALSEDGAAFAEGWNFGPRDRDCRPVEWVLNKLIENWSGSPGWKQDTRFSPHEANFLKLDCSKALSKLKWEPKWELDHTISTIVDWFQDWKSGKNMENTCLNEINSFRAP